MKSRERLRVGEADVSFCCHLQADVSFCCHFGTNRNDGILVQLPETSSALSVDTVQKTACLAQ